MIWFTYDYMGYLILMYYCAFILWFDHFLDSRAEISQIFYCFFVKFKTLKRHPEINWPLSWSIVSSFVILGFFLGLEPGLERLLAETEADSFSSSSSSMSFLRSSSDSDFWSCCGFPSFFSLFFLAGRPRGLGEGWFPDPVLNSWGLEDPPEELVSDELSASFVATSCFLALLRLTDPKISGKIGN